MASSLFAMILPEKIDNRTASYLAVTLVCLLVPLDLVQLTFAALGALTYVVVQCYFPFTAPRRPRKADGKPRPPSPPMKATQRERPSTSMMAATIPAATDKDFSGAGNWRAPVRTTVEDNSCPHVAERDPCCAATLIAPTSASMPPSVATVATSPSVRPVATLTFDASDFDAQVDELIAQIVPTAEDDRIARDLARLAQDKLRKMLPGVQVTGTACGALGSGTAFGVAVPEVDIVISASPSALLARLPIGREEHSSSAQADVRKLQKSAIRACTDCLVASGTFKFRRSAFRSLEPKVTLLAPSKVGICDQAVPVDVSVNCATPLLNAALMTECGQIDSRAKALILLVRRWAKDRGICHAAKGHLPPYAWTLLVIYYLQVGVGEEGPILPPLESFTLSSGLMGMSGGLPTVALRGAPPKTDTTANAFRASRATIPTSRSTVGKLFTGLLNFYRHEVNWRQEAAAVHLGRRAPLGPGADICILEHADGRTEVAPTIQDPFAPSRNVAACATAPAMDRLRAELDRSHQLVSRGAPLSDLLELWRPEDASSAPMPE